MRSLCSLIGCVVVLVAQAELLMFPTEVTASSAGQNGKVTVGEVALPQNVQLLSLSNSTTTFNITQITQTWNPSEQSQDGSFELNLSAYNGRLAYVGAIANIQFVFPQAPKTFIGEIAMEYSVYNTVDQSLQTLTVSAQVGTDHVSDGDTMWDVMCTRVCV